jgi:hypothetical protein
MSIYMLAFLGTLPIGNLIGGMTAHMMGERNALLLCARVAFLCAAAFTVASPLARLRGRQAAESREDPISVPA